MEPVFVGIDVSKDRLDGHVRPSGEAFSVARDAEGLRALTERLRGLPVALVVLEATGGYETVVAATLGAAGLPLAVVNPRQIRDFARAAGRLAKTDALDAAAIAHFAEAMRPPEQRLPDDAMRALGELVARRRQIVEMMGAERQRARLLSQRRLLKGIERHLAMLQKELSALENDIDDAVRGSPLWRERVELLTSVPGVGKTTARTLIAELPELGRLDEKKLAALAGLAPMNRDSGRRHGPRSIRGGRATVRTALYIAATVGVRHNPILKALFDRLRARGRSYRQAVVACAHKLLTILNAIIRDAQPWQPA
jgi:transposase